MVKKSHASRSIVYPFNSENNGINMTYYKDRCELWEFIREINSGISHVKYQFFFPPELLLHNYKCGGYVPCGVTVNTHTIVNLKNSEKCY